MIAARDGYTSALLEAQIKCSVYPEAKFQSWLNFRIMDMRDNGLRKAYSIFNPEFVINYKHGYITGLRDCLKIFRDPSIVEMEVRTFDNIFSTNNLALTSTANMV